MTDHQGQGDTDARPPADRAPRGAVQNLAPPGLPPWGGAPAGAPPGWGGPPPDAPRATAPTPPHPNPDVSPPGGPTAASWGMGPPVSADTRTMSIVALTFAALGAVFVPLSLVAIVLGLIVAIRQRPWGLAALLCAVASVLVGGYLITLGI